MLKTLLVGTALGVLALTATAQAAPEYDYVCNDPVVDKYTGRIMCTVREILRPTQAPWDPKPGQTLMDQIPNWDGEAERVCCGHTWPNCKPGQSPRC
jgi:hypothetical protein